MISIIVAISTNNAIGADNKLLWRLPDDLKRFRIITLGGAVVMGRKTFESLPNGALPDRTNIVISGNSDFYAEGCIIFNDLSSAIDKYKDKGELFIIGGESIYKQTIGLADKLYVTIVHRIFEYADTFFPQIDKNMWILTESSDYSADDKHKYPYTFQTYIRKK
jgi:dihydrofolate reductase